MPIEISEDVLENDEFTMVTDTNGDLVLEHKPTGGQFKFDSANNAWTPVQGLAMGGANISGAGSFDSNDADVSGPVVSNSVDTGSLNSDEITNSGQVTSSAVESESTSLTGTGEYKDISDTRFYYFDSRQGAVSPSEQFRVRFSADTSFNVLMIESIVTAGSTAGSRGVTKKELASQLRRTSLDTPAINTPLSYRSGTDIEYLHTGGNAEFDVIFENTGTDSWGVWAVRIVAQIKDASLEVVNSTIEPS
jgi:hypothetical protein